MMAQALCVAAVALTLTIASGASAQRTTDPVARQRTVYEAIERRLREFRRADADMDTLGLERQSTEGGRLAAYCDGPALRLLIADYFGETVAASDRFYFEHDSLFFVLRQSRRGIPDGVHPYPSRTIVEDERFYFNGSHLVRWLGPKNRSQSVTSPDARRQMQEMLADARRLSAAMPACHPKYAPVSPGTGG
jgi:hypothetical protein